MLFWCISVINFGIELFDEGFEFCHTVFKIVHPGVDLGVIEGGASAKSRVVAPNAAMTDFSVVFIMYWVLLVCIVCYFMFCFTDPSLRSG